MDEILAEYAALQASRRGDSRKAKNLLERIAPASPKDVEPPQPMDSRYDTSLEESDDSIPEDQMKYIKLGAVCWGSFGGGGNCFWNFGTRAPQCA